MKALHWTSCPLQLATVTMHCTSGIFGLLNRQEPAIQSRACPALLAVYCLGKVKIDKIHCHDHGVIDMVVLGAEAAMTFWW